MFGAAGVSGSTGLTNALFFAAGSQSALGIDLALMSNYAGSNTITGQFVYFI